MLGTVLDDVMGTFGAHLEKVATLELNSLASGGLFAYLT
jgi:hypothetical protein